MVNSEESLYNLVNFKEGLVLFYQDWKCFP